MTVSTKILQMFAAIAVTATTVLAQGGGGGEAAPPSMFGGNFLFIMAAMFAIIYFVMIRPEKNRQKERQKMLSALKKGDKIVTIGGIVGVITAVKDISYLMKSGEGTVLEITKSAVQNLVGDVAAAKPTDAPQIKDASDGKESK